MIYLDFEYNSTEEGVYNLVCAVTYDGKDFKDWWLHKDKSQWKALKEYLLSKQKETFVSWAVSAEAGSMVSLGLNPLNFKWIDLQTEYKMLINHWDRFRYGKQKIKGKKLITTNPGNKQYMTEAEKEIAKSNTPESNLVAACYKLLDIDMDSERKDMMRDLIISNPFEFNFKEKEEILLYCKDDVIPLPFMLDKIKEIYKECYYGDECFIEPEEMYWRGRAGALASVITYIGYPIELNWLTNLSNNIPKVLEELCADINSQFEDPLFSWSKKDKRNKKNLNVIQEAISNCPYAENWPKTSTGKFSISEESFSDRYDFHHDFPKGDMIAQYVRYIKTESSLKSMRPQSDKNKMLQSKIGSDGRCRSYLNPYGSQTGRFQPPSTQFLFLKSAWLRSLCFPKEGRVMISMDYASQEFLLSGILSKDNNMIESYKSGDIYMAFGVLSGLIPEGGLKKDYKIERAMCKAAVLGISYGMGAQKLAVKISRDTGKVCEVNEARGLIKNFFTQYPNYKNYREETLNFYSANKFLKSIDGWVLFGDNPSVTSIQNFPVQAAGSAILRKALELCLENKLEVVAPLHDAIYIESGLDTYLSDMKILNDCMKKAATFWFDNKEQKTWAKEMRLDADAWGPDLENKSFITKFGVPLKTQKIYVDERAENEYKLFSKYFMGEV